MLTTKRKTKLINNLPKSWRSVGAEKFGRSVSYIEKVVYGLSKDIEVLNFMIDLAEQNCKKERDAKQQAIERIDALPANL